MGYLMKKTSILFLLLSLCFVSCAGEDDDDGVSVGGGSGPCKGVTCSGHGTCYEIGDNLVSCNCEEGYVAEGIDCILDDGNGNGNGNGNGTDTGSDPCAGVTCSGHGNCYEKDGKPACNCEQGYNAQGTNCVEEGTSDPCAGKDCNDHGTCNASTGQCECEEGWKGDGCENFDNGGPWKVAVTGDVNENSELKYIFCAVRDDQNYISIQLHSSTNGTPPSVKLSMDDINIKAKEYVAPENNLYGGYENNKDTYYTTWRDNISLTITNYVKDVALEGSFNIKDGVMESSENGKQIIVNPYKFNFKCPCIFNGQNSSECGTPR